MHTTDDWAACTAKTRWNLDSEYTIHLTRYSKSFDRYEVIHIGQRHVTVANRYRTLVIGVGTMHLQMRVPDESNKVLIKNVVFNVVLHAPKSKEFFISVPCLTEIGLKVKFDLFHAVNTGKHSIEGIAKRVDQMNVSDQCYDHSEQAHVVTTNDIHI